MDLLEPKRVQIKGQNGTEKTFIFSKFPAIQGREIVSKYPTSILPKIGDYAVSEETMLKLMAFVAVETAVGTEQVLSTRALVNSHVQDWEALATIEWGMLEYNSSFFGNGKTLDIFGNIVATLKASLTEILTASLRQSSPRTKRRSKN